VFSCDRLAYIDDLRRKGGRVDQLRQTRRNQFIEATLAAMEAICSRRTVPSYETRIIVELADQRA